MKAQVVKTILTVPHEGGELAFQHPPFRGTYGRVAEQIDETDLKRPSSAQTSSLVYDALQNQRGEYESQILNILKNNWLWEFTGNLYLPKSGEKVSNGVILETNPQIINRLLAMDKSSLIKRLHENDSNVKFVPFGYKTGEQTHQELGKNPYVIARYGKEGAEKVAEIASNFKGKPYVWSFDSVDEEKTRMSALDGRWGFGGLGVGGHYWGDFDGGHSFGVLKSEKIK